MMLTINNRDRQLTSMPYPAKGNDNKRYEQIVAVQSINQVGSDTITGVIFSSLASNSFFSAETRLQRKAAKIDDKSPFITIVPTTAKLSELSGAIITRKDKTFKINAALIGAYYLSDVSVPDDISQQIDAFREVESSILTLQESKHFDSIDSSLMDDYNSKQSVLNSYFEYPKN